MLYQLLAEIRVVIRYIHDENIKFMVCYVLKKLQENKNEMYFVKQLTFGIKHKGGRNNYGRITIPRRKHLTKQVFRFIDLSEEQQDRTLNTSLCI